MATDNYTITSVASEEDVLITESLAREIWTNHYTPIIGGDQVEYMLQKFQSAEAITSQLKEGYHYFLMNTSKPCGYLSIKTEDKALFISKIYVLNSERGQGLGKKMMNFAIQFALENNCNHLRLTVNKYNTISIEAYEKMGFIKKRDVVFDIGNGYIMDDYEMVKNLK